MAGESLWTQYPSDILHIIRRRRWPRGVGINLHHKSIPTGQSDGARPLASCETGSTFALVATDNVCAIYSLEHSHVYHSTLPGLYSTDHKRDALLLLNLQMGEGTAGI